MPLSPWIKTGPVGIGDFVDQVVDQLHLAARADDVLELVFILELFAKVGVFLARGLKFERTLHGHLQFVDLEWLRHVAMSAHLHRFDRGIDRSVGRNENNERLAMIFLYMPQNIEAAHRLHLHVGDDNLRVDRGHLFDRLGRGAEWENLMPFLPAEGDDDLHHRGLVVYDDDLSHILSAETISRMRKEKANMRIISIMRGALECPRPASTAPSRSN